MNKCLNCGTETKNPKFCSKKCHGEKCFEKHNKRPPKVYLCGCGAVKGIGWKNSNKKYCDTCFNDPSINKNYSRWDLMSIEEYRKKSPNTYQFHARIRSLARSKKKMTPCVKCGYSKHVEVCHIVSIKDFDPAKTVAELNDESNLICLCPNCHWEFDNGCLQS
jgi:hypothetical protein